MFESTHTCLQVFVRLITLPDPKNERCFCFFMCETQLDVWSLDKDLNYQVSKTCAIICVLLLLFLLTIQCILAHLYILNNC